jgi:predicted permease
MWLRALFRRSEVERDLDDELRFHLERETEKLIRLGVSPGEAERRARRAFGGVERIKDDTRDARGTAWIDALIHDVRQAIRGIRRRPGFAVAVIITLGLGLGANVAMFAIVDRLLFRPPAFLKDPAQVHRVYLTREDRTDVTDASMTYTRYRDLARWSTAFSTLAAYLTNKLAVGRGEETRLMDVGIVSANYFDLFDAHPVAGRFFSAREDSLGAGAPVAVISWALWQTRYGGRPAIGETLEIGSLPCTIIGVAPPEFTGVDTDEPVAAFVPINTYPINASGISGNLSTHPSDYYVKYDGWQWVRMLARRRPGVDLAAATADLTHAFRASHEAERAARAGTPTLEQAQPRAIIAPIQAERGPDATNVSRVALWTSGVALIVLLIACANVANLFLVRATERRREHALRIALGVSRARLLAHVVTEIAIFVAPAAILAVGIAVAGTKVLGALFLPGAVATTVLGDPRTFAFAGAAALVAAGLTSVVPSVEIGRTNLAAFIKDGARDSSRRTSRVRHALLSLQGALSVVLLIAAGLFVRSLSNVRTMRLGYDVDPVLYVRPAWEGAKLSDAARVELSRRLLDDARTIPSVSSAALGETLPFSITLSEDLFKVTHDSVLNWPKGAGFTLQSASPEYFHTVGTRVIRGRSITDADRAGAPLVMLVSEAMAKWIWPGQDAIGQCLRLADTAPCRTVVGITEGIKQSSLSDDPGTQYYLPIGQYHPENASLFIRIDGDASRATETVRRHLQHLMPGGLYVTVTPMRDIMGREERSWQLGATMFVALGVLALVLAAVGLYSVIAYGVVQRTRELGVRVALGARTSDVLRLVLGDGVRFTILGLAIGGAIALAVGRWVEPLLFGEHATDPLVFGAVTGILTLTTVAACILPAHRAARVDPNVALRAD